MTAFIVADILAAAARQVLVRNDLAELRVGLSVGSVFQVELAGGVSWVAQLRFEKRR